MTTAGLAGFLRATDLFGAVPASERDAVAAASRVRVFRRGQVVCTAGDPGRPTRL